MSHAMKFVEHQLSNRKILAQATLSAPESLNAISLDMVAALYEQLLIWRDSEDVVAVWLDAEGEKAFCAGGDIVQLYESMVESDNKTNGYAESFFSQEYKLDYLIHTFNKPIVCWGHGIVMGGGVGLMSGCSHRIVTEKTRIAMPEISIGLFPDVGGSWFLSRMPGKSGLFVGLTGASMNAADALFAGFADHFIEQGKKESVWTSLLNLSDATEVNAGELINEVLANEEMCSLEQKPGAVIESHLSDINKLCVAGDINTVVETIKSFETDDAWMLKAIKTLRAGCPVTMCLVDEQIKRAKDLSLSDVFRMELNVAMNCALNLDFREGVRALLIDKDRQPKWTYGSVSDVPIKHVNEHFESRWDQHPLTSL